MTSFWNTSAGTKVQAKSSVEVGGVDMEPIPSNTKVKAIVMEAKWENSSERDEQEGKGEQHIKLRWDVVEGPFKKRVVFQKVFAEHSDSEKQEKALEMLSVIDFNAGGALSKADERPSDMSMTKGLCNKPMIIQVQKWEFTGDDGKVRNGNWVNGVYSASEVKATEAPKKDAAPKQDDFEDDVPF